MIARWALRQGERPVVRGESFMRMRRLALVVVISLLAGLASGMAVAGTAPAPVDVFIYRATPGGIAAAITAARHGRRVVLCEYHSHVGGMTTSGLGKSDIENRAMISGFFKEFVAGVKQHYVSAYGADHPAVAACHDGYDAEPSVAERVFEAMLAAKPTIELVRYHRLDGAHDSDDRLGRESRDEFNEPHAGV